MKKSALLTVCFLGLTALMLLYSKESTYFALTGLQLWFSKMIPALMPFMALSGLMIRLELTENLGAIFTPLLGKLYRVSKTSVYCIIMGFFCGFPMGARVVGELYGRGKLTRQEAQFLLCFCNNIGPIYFVSFALPTMGMTSHTAICLFGMYGIPLLYGLFLRWTVYRKSLSPRENKFTPDSILSPKEKQTFLKHLEDALWASIHGITGLGGYMILFNLCNLIPEVLAQELHLSPGINRLLLPLLNALLEITGGLSRLGSDRPILALILLSFGGLSCMAQTYSMICHTDLSLGSYFKNKLCLTAITTLYYLFLQFSGILMAGFS